MIRWVSPTGDLDDLDDKNWDFELVTFRSDFELKVYVEMVKIFVNVKLERMCVTLEKKPQILEREAKVHIAKVYVPLKKICWEPNFQYIKVWPYLKIGHFKYNKLRWGHTCMDEKKQGSIKMNLKGWADHKFLIRQVMVGV